MEQEITIETKTSTGVEVSLSLPVNKNRCHVSTVLPTIGKINAPAEWSQYQGQSGLLISGYRQGKKSINILLTVSEVDYAPIKAELDRRKKTKLENERRAEAEKHEKALAECPDDCVIARNLWKNGDLCSGEYQTEDGIRVLDSDLLENHYGWYFIRRSVVEQKRSEIAKQKEEKIKKQQELKLIQAANDERRQKILDGYEYVLLDKSSARDEGGWSTCYLYEVTHLASGRKFRFHDRNIFDFGRVINPVFPTVGGMALDVEAFISDYKEADKKAFRESHPTQSGWGWSRQYSEDGVPWIPMDEIEVGAFHVIGEFSLQSNEIRM